MRVVRYTGIFPSLGIFQTRNPAVALLDHHQHLLCGVFRDLRVEATNNLSWVPLGGVSHVNNFDLSHFSSSTMYLDTIATIDL